MISQKIIILSFSSTDSGQIKEYFTNRDFPEKKPGYIPFPFYSLPKLRRTFVSSDKFAAPSVTIFTKSFPSAWREPIPSLVDPPIQQGSWFFFNATILKLQHLPFSHNHGSVENGCISNISFPSKKGHVPLNLEFIGWCSLTTCTSLKSWKLTSEQKIHQI